MTLIVIEETHSISNTSSPLSSLFTQVTQTPRGGRAVGGFVESPAHIEDGGCLLHEFRNSAAAHC